MNLNPQENTYPSHEFAANPILHSLTHEIMYKKKIYFIKEAKF